MTGTTFPPYDGGNNEGNGSYGSQRYDHQSGGQQQQYQNAPQQNQQQEQQRNWGNNQNNDNRTNSNGGSNWGGNSGGGGWKGGNNSGGSWKGNNGGGGWKGNSGGGKQWERPKETDMTMYKPYVIAANQEVPPEIVTKFQEVAMMLENHGYTVRTGGMEGIDEAIEKTVKKIEVHLPWRDFGGKQSKFYYNTDRAFAVAKQFHPAFDTLKKGIQAFLAKNARLVMGDKMISPALFLVCWTEDGCETLRQRNSRTGFTGHPIAIASALGIPIFNLAKPDALQRLNFLVESCNEQIQS